MTSDAPTSHADIGEVLVTEEAIQAKVRELGAPDQRGLRGPEPDPRVSVLKGSLPFMADLMRAIDVPVRIDLMEVSLVRRHGDRVVRASSASSRTCRRASPTRTSCSSRTSSTRG